LGVNATRRQLRADFRARHAQELQSTAPLPNAYSKDKNENIKPPKRAAPVRHNLDHNPFLAKPSSSIEPCRNDFYMPTETVSLPQRKWIWKPTQGPFTKFCFGVKDGAYVVINVTYPADDKMAIKLLKEAKVTSDKSKIKQGSLTPTKVKRQLAL